MSEMDTRADGDEAATEKVALGAGAWMGPDSAQVTGASTFALPSGYTLTMSTDGDDQLSVIAPDGRVCITITLTPEGPKVQVDAASLAVSSRGAMRIEAKTLSLVAEDDLTLAAGGALVLEGHHQRMVSTHGDIHINANDDVRVDGERIRLNAPEPTLRRG